MCWRGLPALCVGNPAYSALFTQTDGQVERQRDKQIHGSLVSPVAISTHLPHLALILCAGFVSTQFMINQTRLHSKICITCSYLPAT